jgi:hypothetical protein
MNTDDKKNSCCRLGYILEYVWKGEMPASITDDMATLCVAMLLCRITFYHAVTLLV